MYLQDENRIWTWKYPVDVDVWRINKMRVPIHQYEWDFYSSLERLILDTLGRSFDGVLIESKMRSVRFD
jgi:hypothetical protein